MVNLAVRVPIRKCRAHFLLPGLAVDRPRAGRHRQHVESPGHCGRRNRVLPALMGRRLIGMATSASLWSPHPDSGSAAGTSPSAAGAPAYYTRTVPLGQDLSPSALVRPRDGGQTNSLAQVITATVLSVSAWMVGVPPRPVDALVVRRSAVARVAEVGPIMARWPYVLMALVVIILNIGRPPWRSWGAPSKASVQLYTAGGVSRRRQRRAPRAVFPPTRPGLRTTSFNAAGTAIAHPVAYCTSSSPSAFSSTRSRVHGPSACSSS